MYTHICICMYVCMYVCMYNIYIYMYVYVYTHICIHECRDADDQDAVDILQAKTTGMISC